MPYRRRALSIGVASSLLAVATVAYAQGVTQQPAPSVAPVADSAATTVVAQATTAPPPATAGSSQSADQSQQAQQLQAVTVTGIRASLQKSLQRKRDNDAITEVITAEDIGKLPATNTAEALAQMPGVTLDRLFGADQRVSIDGLDPSLNLSFIDGHPLAQALWRYGDLPNRGFNYSLLPPEILGAVEVYKTPEARLPEGSLGGTILMHTLQPLDLPANTLRGSAGVNYNDMAGGGRPTASLFYSWRDPGRRFGIDISAQHYEQNTSRQGMEIFGYTPLSTIAPSNAYVANSIASGALRGTDLMPNEINSANFIQVEKRDSVTSNIQFKPFKELELGAGLLWMQDHLSNYNQSMYAFMLAGAGGIDSLTEASQGGVIIAGHQSGECNPNTGAGCTVAGNSSPAPAAPCDPGTGKNCNAGANTTFDNNARQSLITTQGFDLHGTWHGEGWKLYSQVGLNNSHNTLTQGFIEAAFTGSGAYGSAPAYAGGYTWGVGRGFQFDNMQAAQNPANWGALGGFFGNYATEPYSARDMFGQVDFTKDFDGIFNQLLVGFRYAIHHEGEILNVYTGATATGTGAGGVATLNDVGAGALTNLKGQSTMNFLPGSVNHVQPASAQAVYNWVLATPGLYNNYNYPSLYDNSFDVSQANEAAYAQLNFAQDLLRGNIGVRVVRTDTNSSSYQLGSASPTGPNAGPYVTEESIHIDPLPMANVSYQLAPDTILRGALYESIAYAPYNQMAPTVFLNDNVLTGSGGNAHLQPYKSIDLNLAAEWYFAHEALLSGTFFHKQIVNYIEQGADEELQFNTLFQTSPTQYQTIANTPGNICNNTGYCYYGVTRPEDGGRATVDGLAVSFQEPLGNSGFGVRSNFTYAYGVTHAGGPLPYTSKDSVSIVPYFEKGPLQAQLSYNWRSKYLAGGYVAGAPATYTAAYTELDATATYEFTKHIGVTLEGINLMNSTYTQFLGDPSLPTAQYKDGRQFLATLHLKL